MPDIEELIAERDYWREVIDNELDEYLTTSGIEAYLKMEGHRDHFNGSLKWPTIRWRKLDREIAEVTNG